ncbi:stimulated by retinoic acid gene 6 protein-like [Dendronephthya gigantea]|uniref:stimulated by retinoic acid gene 6 protein-like n=1 Tax=Dendronephthya gigantea TaxID=151771 RepID=UPI00106D5A24|nr:stimulated by retinoic acid gene 6 protein-like [Dendronephthya gigantea]
MSGQLRNRWSIAVAFATMLSTTSGLLFQQKFLFIRRGNQDLSNVYSLLNLILTVLTYFLVYYPYLACLMSEHRLVASCLGFCYAAFRYIVITMNTFGCWNYLTQSGEEFKSLKLLLEVPVVIFNAFLFIRFAFLTIYYTWKKFRSPREEDDWLRIVDISTVNYVSCLLNPFKSTLHEKKGILAKFSCTTGFKFSSTTLATFLVSVLLVFNASLIVIRQVLVLEILKFHPLDIIIRVPTIASVSVASLITCGMLVHFLYCHRRNMLRMFQGDKSFLPPDLGSPSHIVGRSLRFCGYQVAAAGWGALALGTILTTASCISVALVHYWEYIISSERLAVIKRFVLFVILPFAGYYLLIWLIIKLLARYVFRDFKHPDRILTINNRKLYNISIFFFYFHTIIMGIAGVLARTFTGIFLGLFFLSRTDRNLMIQGFHNSDRGYASYIGYLHVIALHRNPVRVVFCQILYDLVYKQHVVVKRGKSGTASYPRISKFALNRWHLAVTLIRNPQLQRHRVHSDVPRSRRPTTDVLYLNEIDLISLPSLKLHLNNDDKSLVK